MAQSRRFPLATFLGLCLVPFAAALPGGAPSSVCLSMEPHHSGVQPQTSPPPYTVTASATSYTNGVGVPVNIAGPVYEGLLLKACASNGTEPIGSWMDPPSGTRFLKCGENEKAAITHSSTILKTNSTMYTWMPPDSNCPSSMKFVATVAETHGRYWVGLQSRALQRDAAATCTSGGEKSTRTSNMILLLAATLLFLLSPLQEMF